MRCQSGVRFCGKWTLLSSFLKDPLKGKTQSLDLVQFIYRELRIPRVENFGPETMEENISHVGSIFKQQDAVYNFKHREVEREWLKPISKINDFEEIKSIFTGATFWLLREYFKSSLKGLLSVLLKNS